MTNTETARHATGTRVLIIGNTDTNLHRLGEIVNDQGGWYRIRLEGDKGVPVLFRHEDLIAVVEPVAEEVVEDEDPDAYLFEQAAAAEVAYERHLERGTPDTWADEERDRMVDALGYGPPPGF